MVGDPPGARWIFTTRSGGVSQPPFDELNLADHVGDSEVAVTRNRELVVEQFGESAARSYVMSAEHGNRIETVTRDHGPSHKCDGLVTNQQGIVLIALAADCVPLVLVDSKNGVIGAVHCGWRGVVANIADAAFGAMSQLGAASQSTRAWLGPAICQRCYPVDAERASAFRAVAPRQVAAIDGRECLDVRAAVVAQLAVSGVSTELVGGCTFEDTGMFSFRRAAQTGRQGGAVMLT